MTTLTDHDVFWLARYTHNQLAPLFKEAKAIEPTIYYSIDMRFAGEGDTWGQPHLEVAAWWQRPGMFQQSPILRNKTAVDRFIEGVKKDLASLKDLQEISALLESVSV